jgi:hypothetical protein
MRAGWLATTVGRWQHCDTVLAVILRVARFIPTILDDVFTATRAAFVHHGYLNHAADYSSSLTFSHHPPQLSGWFCSDDQGRSPIRTTLPADGTLQASMTVLAE